MSGAGEDALRRFGVTLLLGLSLTCVPQPANAEETISAEARGYFRNGVELLQGDPPNFQDAYYQFKLAYVKSQSWKVLGNLGLCAVKLERDGEALGFYEEYLRRGGDDINQEEREAIERDMLLIRGNGATLELTSKREELRIQDVRTGSTLAPQTYELEGGAKTLFVRAGGHRLTATASDGRSLVWEVTIEPGATLRHDFDFDAPATEREKSDSRPESRNARYRAPTREEGGGGALATVGFVTGGVGIAAFVGAGGTWLMAQSKEASARERCVNDVCDVSAKPLFRDANDLAVTSTVLLVSGGVLTATGVGLIIAGYGSSGSGTPSAQTGVMLAPLVTGDGAGVLASGRF